jgi:hypothetical protein
MQDGASGGSICQSSTLRLREPEPRPPEARGTYVAYMADDGLWFPDHLNCRRRTREQRLRARLYTSLVDRSRRRPGPADFDLNDPDTGHIPRNAAECHSVHCVAHRRDCLDRYGYWNEDRPPAETGICGPASSAAAAGGTLGLCESRVACISVRFGERKPMRARPRCAYGMPCTRSRGPCRPRCDWPVPTGPRSNRQSGRVWLNLRTGSAICGRASHTHGRGSVAAVPMIEVDRPELTSITTLMALS